MSFLMFLVLLFGSLTVVPPTHSLKCFKKMCFNGNCQVDGEVGCEGNSNRCGTTTYEYEMNNSVSKLLVKDCLRSAIDCKPKVLCGWYQREAKERGAILTKCWVSCCEDSMCNRQVSGNECTSLQDGLQNFNEDIEIVPTEWFETPSVVSFSAECTGENALGLESGLVTKQQMSSSSYDKNHGPENARLNLAADGIKKGAWSAKTNDQNQFLQVDFWRDVKITKFQTQGRQDDDQWVTRYTLSYCANGSLTFQTYQENGVNKVFNGNADRNSIVTHVLQQSIIARYVKINVQAFHNHVSMRAEFYGCVLSGLYQVIGRNVHMDSIKEHLKDKKNIIFKYHQNVPNNIQLEILADTIYVQGVINMHGIKKLTIYSHKVSFARRSRLDLTAPHLSQNFDTLSAGEDGDDGKHGVHGPTVEIFADKIEGYVNILTSGGNGKPGQDGADGVKGVDNTDEQLPIQESRCFSEAHYGMRGEITNCERTIPGVPGEVGGNGEDGGYAGKSGNGGDAGHQTISFRRLRGKMEFTTCRGTGGRAARNGNGGLGGEGGLAGHGVKCYVGLSCVGLDCDTSCNSLGYSERDDQLTRGPPGINGRDGQTLVRAGLNGQVGRSYLQKQELTLEAKQKYPLALIKLMTRYAQDLIWANKVTEAEEVLNFTVSLTKERPEASDLRKVAKQRLAFLNKDGFDRFGRNLLFAPLMKWEAFKQQVENIKEHASEYENAYNGIQESVERQEGIKEILEALPQAAKIQIDKEIERLEEAKRVAISKKRVYVSGISDLEKRMKGFLDDVVQILPEAYENMRKKGILAILSGLTALGSAYLGGDQFAAVTALMGTAEHLASGCHLRTLQDNMDKIEKWLKFGQAYAALEDSSDLNFDEMDVGSIPEIMEANLEMNSETLANDLVCLLGSGPPASFGEKIEQFFIAGGARINLIGEVLELDNSIGGYNFDIANLQETSNTLQSLGQIDDSPIAESIQQTFLDNLLTSYEHIQTSFTNQLYKCYKGFEFRSLWNVNERLTHFQRVARESVEGNGRLQGALQLANALAEIEDVQNTGRQCFTRFRYSTNTHKWTFDNIHNPTMFEQLQQGNTAFLLNISDSCETCYNVRLLKMYVELYGDTAQEQNDLPPIVFLKLRHMGDSYFREGNGQIREFHQPLAASRTFQFNRFALTDSEQCNEEKKKGVSGSLFCMEEDDVRFQPMCCHYLSDSPCDDVLLGAEECTSPFGTYELSMPISDTLPCQAISPRITHNNCRDFDRSIYTKMNVWIHYLYWADGYPTGPDDVKCSSSSKSKVPLSKSSQAPKA